jgi:Uma2 family endonuclease
VASAEPAPDAKLLAQEHVATADQRIIMHHIPWSHYEAELAVRGEKSVPRISFLRGTLELMRPSRDHERISAWIARLVEIFAEERGIELSPYGSWTLKHPEHAGAEPDECYIVGEDLTKQAPDLAIEVVWTRGGIDKLEIYRYLGISEVWFWIDGEITLHVLRGDRYERAAGSGCVPGIDVAVLCSFLDRPLLSVAKREYRAAIRAGDR